MSLANAVLEIAMAMTDEATDLKGSPGADLACMSLKGYARQLLIAVKAAEGERPPVVSSNQTQKLVYCETCGTTGGHQPWCAKVQERQQAQQAKAVLEAMGKKEESGGGLAACEIVGGPLGGDDGVPTMVERPNVPNGAYLPMSDRAVYQYKDGKLIYSPEQTKRFLEAKEKPSEAPKIVTG